MFKIRQRNCLLIATLLVLAPCIVILMIMGPELSTEQSLTQRLAECHMRLQYLESMYRARQEDVSLLSQYVGQLQISSSSSSNNTVTGITSMPSSAVPAFGPIASLVDALSPEARQLLRNASHASRTGVAQRYTPTQNIRLPNAYHFLPHLLDDASSLRPAYLQSKGRADVSIVLGVPTVKREKQSYLLSTLHNLIENMNEEEQNETLIIVYIGETELETVQLIAKQIEHSFEQHVESGLIDIIAPSPSYYPNFETLRITLNDPLERVKWRSKQNLDFAYLMAYAQAKGTFYVQLEDDILTKRHFITTMKKFALIKSALTKRDQPAWFVLDFCQLGFIGKMFKSAELPYLITYFQMFYNDKPVDWLLSYFIESKVCRTDKDQKHCNQEKAKYWQHFRKSLFQHIGTSSSLKGKVQKLKDKQFGSKVPTYYAHIHNPPAFVKSNIAPYKNYVLKRAYRGETYFWGLLPQPGDLVQFIFEQPILLRRYLFRSGNSEHPSDRFYNTTVELLPADSLSENSSVWSIYNTTTDGYLVVGAFDALGVAESVLDPKIGAIKELRLHVHSDSENWALLSEIELQQMGANGEENAAKPRFAAGS
ncbi:alpha-1,3-mannosyl-glycoprotein 4-beta-N-acetylglucosaminyltransferase A [Scaptodrosophila lebanonensis]|uniref:Alpha-1,3-mannosyl-glycoprotein 4-beta-N-acetylglucosaminyltransferase A n=1 Tax=Drosophila lebanonensis TaxID=7225 RepID=A0A6J2UF36_DROLE|nr:alpha-1,3-mannosyl-glycoprotein 4-beta-N-acetylglucosaminyltransferase A [Scaptodrosophila lebanonensis]XP_030386021.1 alpha-1,3-mannosyl-glycoprotein 4-beta-N-acetylglucosaminyltransferase A [Scaptodrosophila lebanonensis]XP_030386022.1 alpha-1,3-mannosyl-glycoprotein 4-beta-N-acetylglucosaminyltransferase A [Scaptodrosophila lebanonensis]XP_030386023.1 alpha-1,3-mannosyl-glycoprotein 4-beta-N-acetylglucosaminyltransferase A [Scaptodrosophila lebanonensis]